VTILPEVYLWTGKANYTLVVILVQIWAFFGFNIFFYIKDKTFFVLCQITVTAYYYLLGGSTVVPTTLWFWFNFSDKYQFNSGITNGHVLYNAILGGGLHSTNALVWITVIIIRLHRMHEVFPWHGVSVNLSVCHAATPCENLNGSRYCLGWRVLWPSNIVLDGGPDPLNSNVGVWGNVVLCTVCEYNCSN